MVHLCREILRRNNWQQSRTALRTNCAEVDYDLIVMACRALLRPDEGANVKHTHADLAFDSVHPYIANLKVRGDYWVLGGRAGWTCCLRAAAINTAIRAASNSLCKRRPQRLPRAPSLFIPVTWITSSSAMTASQPSSLSDT